MYYYENAKLPKKRETSFDLEETSDSEQDVAYDDQRKIFKKNPRARVEFMKQAFLDETFDTELEMMMCETLLKDGYDFLLKFQTYDVMIHLLYQTYRSLLLDVLMEIVEPAGLKYSRGSSDILSGKDMKKLVLETKEERKARKEEEIRKQDDVQSKKKIGKEKVVPPRRAQLLPVEKILRGER